MPRIRHRKKESGTILPMTDKNVMCIKFPTDLFVFAARSWQGMMELTHIIEEDIPQRQIQKIHKLADGMVHAVEFRWRKNG